MKCVQPTNSVNTSKRPKTNSGGDLVFWGGNRLLFLLCSLLQGFQYSCTTFREFLYHRDLFGAATPAIQIL